MSLFRAWLLKRRLTNMSRSYDERIEAAERLAEIATPHAANALTAGLDAVSWEVRAFVQGALTRLGSTAVPALIPMLHHAHASTRYNAIELLMRIGDARAVAPIRTLLTDPIETVRAAATAAVQQLADRAKTNATHGESPICVRCKCPVYEFAMDETERMMALGRITGNARVLELISTQCTGCGVIQCAGCANRAGNQCTQCKGRVVSTRGLDR